MSVTPSRPYLLRGLYEWLNDNGLTPLLIVDATVAGVEVPLEYVQDGQITLNISPSAAQGVMIENEAVSFNARFNGVVHNVYVPMAGVLAIFARENALGMGFGLEPAADALQVAGEDDDPTPSGPDGSGSGESKSDEPKKERPTLRVVK